MTDPNTDPDAVAKARRNRLLMRILIVGLGLVILAYLAMTLRQVGWLG